MFPEKAPEICVNIRDRVDKWEKYWTINRSLYYEWTDFIMGDQWREDESKLFERYNKIPLVFNKCGVLMNHLLSDQIQNTTNLQIVPDENVPVRVADIRSALIRSISLNSDAKRVYHRAFGQAIVGGYGAFTIGTQYTNDDSFNQEIIIRDIDDPNRCYWDISATRISKIDGMFGGFRTRVSRQRFRDKYGKNVESQVGTSAVTEDSTMAFADDDSVTIVDDFERSGEKEVICQLSNQSVIKQDEIKYIDKQVIDGKKYLIFNGEPVTIVNKRDVVRYRIVHKKIAGDFVLSEEDFPSEDIPVVFVDQKSYYTKQGQQITRSFFKDVKDAQKYLNYLATQSAYIMKISRYDQFMAPRKCVSAPDTAQLWRDPSVVRGVLPYDETPSGLKPEPLHPPELSASLTQQYERTLMDIQSGTGMYNTQLGELGNEVSGTAVEARTKRGTKNTYVPFDSLDQSVVDAGIIINQMIPLVYDTERLLMLNMPDAEGQPIKINVPVDEYGLHFENDIRKGKYKIRLKPGPSYEGQKTEALESLQLVLNADKSGSVFPMIADMYVENLPLDNNIELRNRLRTLVPPEIIEAGKTGKPLPPKPQAPSPEQQMMQLKAQELQQKAQAAQQEAAIKLKTLELKQAELQRKAIETHQDMTVEWEKLAAEKEEAAAKLQETILRYEAESKRMQTDIEISNSQNLIRLLTHNRKHNSHQEESV